MQTILLKDQFIFGVTVREIQEHLPNEITDEQDLNATLVEARKIESRIAQCKLLGPKSVQYDVVNQGQRGRSKKKSKSKDSRQKSRSQSGIRDCKYCGNNHPRRQCPAYGKECKACGRKNHFAKKCLLRNKSTAGTHTGNKKLFKYRQISADHESSDEGQQIDEITSKVKSLYYNDVHFDLINTRMYVNLSTNSCNGTQRKTRFKVDTGADGNLLPLAEFFKHFPNANLNNLARTVNSSTKLYAYNNTEIKQLGVCELLVEYKDSAKVCEFYVVDFPTTILGIHDSESLKLLTVHFNAVESEISQGIPTQLHVHAIQSESDKFSTEIRQNDLFTGIGNMNTEINIKLKDNALPYVAPIRRVAYALQEPLKMELEKLVDEGILRKLKIDEKSEWLNTFVCVRKPNGSIRLCLDPTHLNKYIVRPHHNSKTLDDILPKLVGAKKFSIVDSTKSFFNLSLTKRASLLTTFGTMYGRYCYLRVPMGASLSSDVYQFKVDEIFQDIPQCEGIANDIVIFGYNDTIMIKRYMLCWTEPGK